MFKTVKKEEEEERDSGDLQSDYYNVPHNFDNKRPNSFVCVFVIYKTLQVAFYKKL